MKEEIDWHDIRKEPLMQSWIPSLLCNAQGHITIGYLDDFGYQEYGSNNEFYNVIAWADLPKGPMFFEDCIITNDKWVELVAKQGLLK